MRKLDWLVTIAMVPVLLACALVLFAGDITDVTNQDTTKTGLVSLGAKLQQCIDRINGSSLQTNSVTFTNGGVIENGDTNTLTLTEKTVEIAGDATVSGTLGVTGDTTVSNLAATGTADVTGDATVGGTLGVTGAVTMGGGATWTGDVDSVETDGTWADGDMSCAGFIKGASVGADRIYLASDIYLTMVDSSFVLIDGAVTNTLDSDTTESE